MTRARPALGSERDIDGLSFQERDVFIDNLLVRIHAGAAEGGPQAHFLPPGAAHPQAQGPSADRLRQGGQ